MKLESLHDLYLKELRDLYGSEQLLAQWLPKVLDQAESPELRDTLAGHLEQTRTHVSRLERLFLLHEHGMHTASDKGMEGIVAEADKDMGERAPAFLRDCAVMAALQKVEHHEIACYRTLRSYAEQLGYKHDARLLQTTLEEEVSADQKLTHVATGRITVQATRTA